MALAAQELAVGKLGERPVERERQRVGELQRGAERRLGRLGVPLRGLQPAADASEPQLGGAHAALDRERLVRRQERRRGVQLTGPDQRLGVQLGPRPHGRLVDPVAGTGAGDRSQRPEHLVVLLARGGDDGDREAADRVRLLGRLRHRGRRAAASASAVSHSPRAAGTSTAAQRATARTLMYSNSRTIAAARAPDAAASSHAPAWKATRARVACVSAAMS